jgi:peptidoglycan/xylan/chitin deacetylase (PgdA/CDA1 family)
MLGQNAQRNPSIADRIVNEGHEVGCHSARHLNAWKVSPWRAIADIKAGYDTLLPWIPANGIYRPPYGKMTLPTYWAIRRRGAWVGWWTIDSGDVRSPLPEPARVVDLLLSEGGGIILMHDLDRSVERNDFVLETTALLLETATRRSFRVAQLGALCQ